MLLPHSITLGVKSLVRKSTARPKKGSLHYLGLAVDLRTKDLTPIVIESYYNALKLALSRLCDVILEKDHIHVEYQPKG